MKVLTFDFEMTELQSDKSFILCGGFKAPGKKPEVITYYDVPPGKDDLLIDADLAVALRDKLEGVTLWQGWNSRLFDIPHLNDRLLLAGEREIVKKLHADFMWFAAKGQSCLTSRRLDWVARALNCPVEKTALDLRVWKLAGLEALSRFKKGHENYDQVVKHCKHDIIVTEWVADRLWPRVRNVHV